MLVFYGRNRKGYRFPPENRKIAPNREKSDSAPGVLIIEALAQTGCVLLLSKEENKGKIAFFAGINKARFRKQVIPGDVLTMTVTLTKEKGGIYFAAIEAKVEDEIAVTGEIMCAVGE